MLDMTVLADILQAAHRLIMLPTWRKNPYDRPAGLYAPSAAVAAAGAAGDLRVLRAAPEPAASGRSFSGSCRAGAAWQAWVQVGRHDGGRGRPSRVRDRRARPRLSS